MSLFFNDETGIWMDSPKQAIAVDLEQPILLKEINDFLSYLQNDPAPKSAYISAKLKQRGIMTTKGFRRYGAPLLSLIDFLHEKVRVSHEFGYDDPALFTTNFRRQLQQRVDSLQATHTELLKGDTTQVVDFTSNQLETFVKLSDREVEWTFAPWEVKLTAITTEPSLSREEKIVAATQVVQQFFATSIQIGQTVIHQLITTAGEMLPEWKELLTQLPTPRKLAITAAIVATLVIGKQTKDKIMHAHTLQQVVTHTTTVTKQPATKEAIIATVKKHVDTQKKQPTQHTSNKSEKLTSSKHVVEPITPLPIRQPQTLKPTKIAGVPLFKDPKSEVYYRKVKQGETISQIRDALTNDETFDYLDGKRYDPKKHGNVLSRNLPANTLQPGQLVPIPLEKTETLLSDEALFKVSAEALDQISSHETYGQFVQNLEQKLGRKHLLKLMAAFAKKESNQGATSVYRFEPGYKAYSYSIYHILTERSPEGKAGPGLRALLLLGFSSGEVMEDEMKAGQWFRAYRYEKFQELKYTKKYKKYADHPEKFFAKKHVDLLGKIYNGTEKYGDQLEDVFDEIK